MADLRSQLKATSIKKLKKRVDEDNTLIGAVNNEYLNLEDGKTIKIRIFPGHPGQENFYVPKKCYWLTVAGNDGEPRRTTVLDSKLHGETKFDLCEEYTKLAKKVCAGNTAKMEAISGQKDSLNPQYSWMAYASKVIAEEQLHPMIWEFKKMVRDALNKLAFSEDEDEAIETDPFTDPDEGLPVLAKYLKTPNKKKGENYYEVTFAKKVAARPLTDEEVEVFMALRPLSEVLTKYGIKDFDRALEGLQNFDEEHEIGLFDNDEWLEKVEEIKAQYDEAEEEEQAPAKKKTVKPAAKVAEKPAKKAVVKKVVEEEPEEEPEEDVAEEEAEDAVEADEFDDMDRNTLKLHIKHNALDIVVKKSMTDDDIRVLIRELSNVAEEPEADEPEAEEDEPEEEAPKSKVTLADIKKKLAGKK